MTNIKDMIRWVVILCVVALLFYIVFPKYKFMGPNDFAVYRCNIVTGQVKAWDIDKEKWVVPTSDMMSIFAVFISE